MTPRKIYVVGGSVGYACWMQGVLADSMKDACVVLFTGGEDINPALYGKRANPKTYFNTSRDTFEVLNFKRALEMKKPMVGVCRGAQLLCAMAGGILIQDQEDQGFLHPVFAKGETSPITVTSLHHQAQWPYCLQSKEYDVLAWSNNLSRWHHGENDKQELLPKEGEHSRLAAEVEVCYYREINALAIQSHPEIMCDDTSPHATRSTAYMRGLLNKLLEGKL